MNNHTDESDQELPTVRVDGRTLGEISPEVANILLNSKYELYDYLGGLARIEKVGSDVQTSLVSETYLRGAMDRTAIFVNLSGRNNDAVRPPMDVVRDILEHEVSTFSVLKGISRVPLLRADGTICADNGYDPQTESYNWLPSELSFDVNPDCSQEDAREAAKYVIDELLCDFPFANEASRANAVAMYLTPVVRSLINGCAPLFGINAATPGTGKGLLVDLASIVVNGCDAPRDVLPKDDQECRKRITSILRRSPDIVMFDNYEGEIQSAALAACITAEVWQDRIMRTSKHVKLPNRALWVINGNNIEVGTDFKRRTILIDLESTVYNPHERNDFRHNDIRKFTHNNRGKIMSCLYTMASAWIRSGRPESDLPSLGSFESWSEVVGGIVSFAGVEGLLENSDRSNETCTEDKSFADLLEIIQRFCGSKPQRAREIYNTLVIRAPDWVQLLPYPEFQKVQRGGDQAVRALGELFRSKKRKRVNSAGLRIEHAGQHPASKTALWQLMSDEKDLSAGSLVNRPRVRKSEKQRTPSRSRGARGQI